MVSWIKFEMQWAYSFLLVKHHLGY
uniref:Uncharacterized protein n=1 Tax=Tetranychus urticae TaxID=32264 RepID=T1KCI3_TETUR